MALVAYFQWYRLQNAKGKDRLAQSLFFSGISCFSLTIAVGTGYNNGLVAPAKPPVDRPKSLLIKQSKSGSIFFKGNEMVRLIWLFLLAQ